MSEKTNGNGQDDVTVTDRRRFTAEGEPLARDAEESAPDAGRPAAEEAAGPSREAIEAREWEHRALAAEAKLNEIADGYRRATLELDNVRARLAREQDNRVREAVGRAFTGILDALDNLDRALAHAGDGPFPDGVRLVRRQLLDVMAAQGLERLDVVGRPFDPAEAEAVLTVPASDAAPAQTVVEELRCGYRFGDRILRPAQVKVAL